MAGRELSFNRFSLKRWSLIGMAAPTNTRKQKHKYTGQHEQKGQGSGLPYLRQENPDKTGREGECATWIHRQCAGVSSAMFKMLGESDIPFKCVYCTLQTQNREIQQLKDTVRTLTDELTLIKQSQPQQLSNEPAAATSLEPSGDSENPNITRPIVMKSNNTDDKSKPNNLHLEKN